jgi:prepilin-type N-terminal cleavage/methylation domain-containing protein
MGFSVHNRIGARACGVTRGTGHGVEPGAPRHARCRYRRGGFTAVELLIVVVIIGIMAAAVMPTIGDMRSDARQGSAAHDIVRMGRRARALTMETGVAHLLRFQRGNDARGSFGLGRFELFAGMTNRCRQTPWELALDPNAAEPLGIAAARREGPNVLDMVSFNPTDGATSPTDSDTSGRVVIRVRAFGWTPEDNVTADRPAVQICYQPNGQTYTLFAGQPGGIGLRPQMDLVTFTIERRVGGGTRGVTREVVFPVGGNARVRY